MAGGPLHLRPSYQGGYAKNANQSKFPWMWQGLTNAWCPLLGHSGATLRDLGPGDVSRGRTYPGAVEKLSAETAALSPETLWEPKDGEWASSFNMGDNGSGPYFIWQLERDSNNIPLRCHNGGKEFTLLCFAKLRDIGIGGDARYFCKGSGATSASSHTVMVGMLNGTRLRTRMELNGTTTTLFSQDTVPAGFFENWHFVAVTCTESSPTETRVDLWCAGLGIPQVSSVENDTVSGSLTIDDSRDVAIGNNPRNGSQPLVGTGVDGWIDDIRIYDRALTQKELDIIWREGRGSLYRLKYVTRALTITTEEDILPHNFGQELFAGNFDFNSETDFYMSLHTTALTPTATMSYWSEVSSTEVVGAGYSVSGKLLTNTTVSRVDTSSYFTADNPQWNPITMTSGGYAVTWKKESTPETSPLVSIHSFTETSTNSENIAISIPSTGIVSVS